MDSELIKQIASEVELSLDLPSADGPVEAMRLLYKRHVEPIEQERDELAYRLHDADMLLASQGLVLWRLVQAVRAMREAMYIDDYGAEVLDRRKGDLSAAVDSILAQFEEKK